MSLNKRIYLKIFILFRHICCVENFLIHYGFRYEYDKNQRGNQIKLSESMETQVLIIPRLLTTIEYIPPHSGEKYMLRNV